MDYQLQVLIACAAPLIVAIPALLIGFAIEYFTDH